MIVWVEFTPGVWDIWREIQARGTSLRWESGIALKKKKNSAFSEWLLPRQQKLLDVVLLPRQLYVGCCSAEPGKQPHYFTLRVGGGGVKQMLFYSGAFR